MKNLLIFCPNIGGHSQIYCNVIADWALSRGYFVYLAYGGAYVYDGYKVSKKLTKLASPYITYYENVKNIKLINVLNDVNGMTLEQEYNFIRNLQKDLEIDITILPDGSRDLDNLRIFYKQNKLNHRRLYNSFTICFCLQTGFYYKNFLRRYLGIRELKSIIDFDRIVIFDEFLFKKIKSRKFGFMPDISTSYNVKQNATYDKKVMDRYTNFLQVNKNKEIVFYFGQANLRKGYDILLKLVSMNYNLVLVHCGEIIKSIREDQIIMSQLKKENRIFLYNTFVTSDKMISEFFNSINFFVLGHRNHYLSSGTMIQALLYNKPLIVPNKGLMGRRVKVNKIGLVYRHCSIKDLNQKIIFMSQSHKKYLNTIKNYKKAFSQNAIFSYLDKNICDDRR